MNKYISAINNERTIFWKKNGKIILKKLAKKIRFDGPRFAFDTRVSYAIGLTFNAIWRFMQPPLHHIYYLIRKLNMKQADN